MLLRLLRRTADATNFLEIPLPEVPGRLFVSPMPFGPYDTSNSILRAYMARKIDRVIPLVTDDEIAKKAKRDILTVYTKAGMAVSRVAFADLTAPVRQEIEHEMPTVLQGLRDAERIVVHCNAGVGRTGVMVCCILRALRGCSGQEAIDYAIGFMQTNLTDEQRRFIERWEFKPCTS